MAGDGNLAGRPLVSWRGRRAGSLSNLQRGASWLARMQTSSSSSFMSRLALLLERGTCSHKSFKYQTYFTINSHELKQRYAGNVAAGLLGDSSSVVNCRPLRSSVSIVALEAKAIREIALLSGVDVESSK